MKVTYNWLKDFVEIKITPEALAEKLTMSGLEVVSLEQKNGDFIFEIEVTPNRPDCLSVIGIAREVAAITDKKLKLPRAPSHPACPCPSGRRPAGRQASRQSFGIKIENKKDCPLYTAKIIKDVKVGPSPDWLRNRLELVGCRSVNNVVDITNYVLFELGEPLHAFDLDKLETEVIIVRRAKNTEKLTTIDSEERVLNPNILAIADKEKAVAIAGIMGGKDTEVAENTKNVLLEAAVFNPVIVRRTRQALGLESEAAYRFERGVDLGILEKASWRTIELIQELAGGRIVLAKTSGMPQAKKKNISLEVSTVHKVLGIDASPLKIKKILTNLGFKVNRGARNNFRVEVPSYRPDVNLEMDLIEEIARISGYEHIPTTVPAVCPQPTFNATWDSVFLIKNILVGLGLNEVITYSLLDKQALNGFWDKEDNLIEILNPLSQEQEILRPILMPSLAACIAYNLQQKQPHINIFEIAKTYKNYAREQYVLGIALSGTKSIWYGPEGGHLQDKPTFLHLKGILETLFKRLGCQEKEYKFIMHKDGYLAEVWVNQVKIGILRKLERNVLDRLDIKHKEVFLAEVALEELLPKIKRIKKFESFSRYPWVVRDTNLQIKEEIPLEQIMEEIAGHKESLLETAEFKSYFKGADVPAGLKRIAVSFRYCSGKRTLTEEEVNSIHAKIINALKERFGATVC